MPTSIKVWLACPREAGREPVFVVLDEARGELRARLKETVWIHRFAQAGMKLHNKAHDSNSHLKRLRTEHARSGSGEPFDEAMMLEALWIWADRPPEGAERGAS